MLNNNYGKYKEVRDATWQILIEYNVKTLPINPVTLANIMGIKVYQNKDVHILEENQLAISMLTDKNEWFIVYDESITNKGRRRFTLAHELGHIVLGHQLVEKYHARTFDTKKLDIEKEADSFAIRLLAPACVIWGLKLDSPVKISEMCGISFEAATNRYERIKILEKRNKFLTSPLEKQLFSQFEDYIEENTK